MDNFDIRIGEAVRPKSGGPRMIAEEISEVGGVSQVTCVWQDQYQREARRVYPASLLKRANIEALGDLSPTT